MIKAVSIYLQWLRHLLKNKSYFSCCAPLAYKKSTSYPSFQGNMLLCDEPPIGPRVATTPKAKCWIRPLTHTDFLLHFQGV